MKEVTQLTNEDVNFIIYVLEFHKATLQQKKNLFIRAMGKCNYEIACNQNVKLLNKLKN